MFASPAFADFRVCNATQSLVGVAIGYRAAAGWVTEGWWHIEGSTCKTLIEGPLASRYYYLYAEDAERGGRWDGPTNMCVAEKEFKITAVNDCLRRGFQRAGFQRRASAPCCMYRACNRNCLSSLSLPTKTPP